MPTPPQVMPTKVGIPTFVGISLRERRDTRFRGYDRRGEQASILIICLWTVAMLSILGMGLTALVFQEIKSSSAISRLYGSLPVAQAALKSVLYARAQDLTPGYDTWEELTQENSDALCQTNSYKYYFTDKKEHKDSVEIIDEGALINLNTASLDVLKRLPGVDEDLADRLAHSGLRPYTSINEVLLAEGMSVDKFRLFKDMVTVYGNGKVNINTVSKPVLICLGLDEELVDKILRFRKEHKIEPPLDAQGNPIIQEEEYGFSSVSSMVSQMNSSLGLSLRQEQDLISAQSYLSVKSEYLRLNIIPQLNRKDGTRYSAVIYPAAKKILSWREY